MSDPSQPLPVSTFAEAAPFLRRPFTVAAVRFRVLDGKDTGQKARARCAAYIDARLAIERLNLVCPQLWQHDFQAVPGGMRCDITLDGLRRGDVGWSRGTTTDMDLKALYSDAFKRAAVHFGIGVSLYAIPGLTIYARAGHVRVWERQGKQPSYYLTDAGEVELRKRYRTWLEQTGQRAFGEPLDHGDPEHEPEGELPPEDEPKRIDEAAALALYDYAEAAGIPADKLQLAASHAAGHDVGDCSTRELALSALGSLTDKQASLVDAWITKKVDEAKAEAK